MTMKLIVVFMAVLMYALIVAFEEKKLLFSSGTAVLLIILATIFPERIFPLPEDVLAVEGRLHVHTYALIHSFTEVLDWNCMLLLTGSMFFSSVLVASKSLESVACEIMVRKRNLFWAYFILAGLTVIVSVFAGNVAAVTVFVPLAVAIFSQAQVNPVSAVILLSIVSNLEMFSSITASPAAMVYAGFSNFRFNDFLIHDGRPSFFFVAQIAVAFCIVLFWFTSAKYKKSASSVRIPLNVTRVPLYILGFMIAGLWIISLFYHRIEIASGIFVFFVGIISLVWYRFFFCKSSIDFYECLSQMNFGMLAFVASLFIVSGALKESGVLSDISSFLLGVSKGSIVKCFIFVFIISFAVGFLLEAVTCVSVIYPVAFALSEGFDVFSGLFIFTALAGLSIGNSFSPYASLTNIITLGILEKEGNKITVNEWIKKGLPFAVSASVGGILFLMIFMR